MLTIKQKNRMLHWLLCEGGIEQADPSNLQVFEYSQLPKDSDLNTTLIQDSEVEEDLESNSCDLPFTTSPDSLVTSKSSLVHHDLDMEQSREMTIEAINLIYSEEFRMSSSAEVNNTRICHRILSECYQLPDILTSYILGEMSTLFSDRVEGLFLSSDFVEYCDKYLTNCDRDDIVFNLISGDGKYLTTYDLHQLALYILDFVTELKSNVEHYLSYDIYADTISAILLFRMNISGSGCISREEMGKSDFVNQLYLAAEQTVDSPGYYWFSFESVFVIWKLFADLDSDSDMFLTKDDLRNYGDVCFTELALDCVMQGRGRCRVYSDSSKLSYEDFVYLVIADENKRCQQSVWYWFNVLDLDFSGRITVSTVYSFYFSQKARLEEYGIASLPFHLYFQTIQHLLGKQSNEFTYSDFVPSSYEIQLPILYRSIAIDVFVNTVKYLEFERRELTQEIGFDGGYPHLTDWNSFLLKHFKQLKAKSDNRGTRAEQIRLIQEEKEDEELPTEDMDLQDVFAE